MDIRQIVREASAKAYGLAGSDSDNTPCIVVIASDAVETVCESNLKAGNSQVPALLRLLADSLEKAELAAARQKAPPS